MLPWLLRDESLHAIGLGAPGGMWPFAILACAALGAALVWQRRSIKHSADGAQAVRSQLARVSWVIPRTRNELVLWGIICLHAGMFEELFYRGYLLSIARGLAPDWVALLAVTILFGLGHLYQGARGIVQTALIGAVFLALAWFSQSLWPPMLAHALFDWHAGTLGRWALYGNAK
jgi:membrane protease YdiL (CAAX protease family)